MKNFSLSLFLICSFLLCECFSEPVYLKNPPKELVNYYTFIIDNIQTKKVFLCSYPRSGNSWLRYCIENIAKTPTLEMTVKLSSHRARGAFDQLHIINMPYGMRFDFPIDTQELPIIKTHWMPPHKYYSQLYHDAEKDKFIFLLRNYKECIPSHRGLFKDCYFDMRYLNLLADFDAYPDENKILVYYEDLINEPEQELKRLLVFLNKSEEFLDEFLKEYEFHKSRSISDYSKFAKKSSTNGNEILYHSKRLSQKQREYMDNFVQENQPDLLEKYLFRYLENK